MCFKPKPLAQITCLSMKIKDAPIKNSGHYQQANNYFYVVIPNNMPWSKKFRHTTSEFKHHNIIMYSVAIHFEIWKKII